MRLPGFIFIKVADEFKDKTTAINQLWQTDFTYLEVIGWGWMYLSTILDDYSRYIIAWKLCTTIKTSNVPDTLDLALQASGCVRPILSTTETVLSDNGSCYVSGELAEWLGDKKMGHVRGPYHRGCQVNCVSDHVIMFIIGEQLHGYQSRNYGRTFI